MVLCGFEPQRKVIIGKITFYNKIQIKNKKGLKNSSFTLGGAQIILEPT